MEKQKALTVIRCEACGGRLQKRQVKEFRDDLLGIANVVLLDAVEQKVCEDCNEVATTTIPDLNGLIAAVAITRALFPAKLGGPEIRFMRGALGLTAKKLAAKLEVREETVSRWEHGKEPIRPQSEKLLRMMAGSRLRKAAPGIDFKQRHVRRILDMQIDPLRSPPEMRFHLVKVQRHKRQAWEPLAA